MKNINYTLSNLKRHDKKYSVVPELTTTFWYDKLKPIELAKRVSLLRKNRKYLYADFSNFDFVNFSNQKRIEELKRLILHYENISSIPDFPSSGFGISKWDVEVWKFFGWTEKEAKEKVSDLQTKNANRYAKKRKQNPKKYAKSSTTNIEYWLNKGFSKREAENELYKRQSTFTLEKCIEKYGKKKGSEIFVERQNKWQETLRNRI